MEADLQLNLTGDSTFKGNTSLSNLQVKDPESEAMKSLESELDLDLSWNTQQLDIRPSSLKLTPTAQGGNVLKLSGQIPLLPFDGIQRKFENGIAFHGFDFLLRLGGRFQRRGN
jgi:hypothetical protein